MAPWTVGSALDAVEMMDNGWNYNREHLRISQRSHRVIINGGDQPNVGAVGAAVGITSERTGLPHIKSLYKLGNTVASPRRK